TFTITVNPINDPPTGTADTYVVRVGQTLDVLASGLLGNDIDIEIVALNLVGFSPLQVGTNANTGMFDIDPNVGGDGSFRFTAPATPGTVTFTYDLEDGGDGASLPLTSNGIMVTINVIVPQTLTVTKIVVNDGGGPLGVSDFPLFIDDELTTSGEDAMVTAGAHTVSETGDPDYTAVFSGACDADGNVTVAAGGTAECIITNTFVPLPPVPLPDLIFTDGFESGDTTMWSSSFPQGTNTGTYQGGGGTNTSGLRTAQGAAVPIADAVATIVGDYAAIYTYDAATKTFAVYRPDPALAFLNTLTTLTPGQAFFIEVTSPDGLVWEQAVSLTAARSIALVSGFNFVGWSGPELAPLEDAIAGIRDLVRSAFLWDPEAQEYLIYFRDAPAGINTLDVIPYSRAIWLFMDGAATWDQPARDG
ncbi:MAG: Ig-like domain-containing protein, partial [Chloroflexi bacterium]|nr:Ig-like domain-containing protein [Chloroflexota bacterium]